MCVTRPSAIGSKTKVSKLAAVLSVARRIHFWRPWKIVTRFPMVRRPRRSGVAARPAQPLGRGIASTLSHCTTPLIAAVEM